RTLAVRLALRRTYPEFKEALALVEANLKGDGSLQDKRVKAMVLATQPGQRAAAIALFESLSPLDSPTPPDVLVLLPNLHHAEGKWEHKAWPCIQKALQAEPKNPALLAYATRALLRHGE